MHRKRLNNIEMKEVYNHPEIKKQMMISSGEFPNIMSFGKAVFKPKQKTDPHLHESMDEIFFIISGKGLFHTNKESINVEKDDCISIPSGETHWQENPFEEDLELLYFGIKN